MFTGTQFAKRGYTAYGQTNAGGGGAILHSSVRAFNLRADRTAGGVTLMVAITALIAWLADRQAWDRAVRGRRRIRHAALPGPTDAQIALFLT
jgi:hypothetical protein